MRIEVLGMGCKNCRMLFDNASQAVREAQLAAEVVKVDDMQTIMGYGLLKMPGLVVDGALKTSGRVLSVAEIRGLL